MVNGVFHYYSSRITLHVLLHCVVGAWMCVLKVENDALVLMLCVICCKYMLFTSMIVFYSSHNVSVT